MDLTKIINFCSTKDNVKRIKRQATDLEKMIVEDTIVLIKDYYPKYTEKTLKLNDKKSSNLQ